MVSFPASQNSLFFSSLLFLLLATSLMAQSFRPRAVYLPVVKDKPTLQYVALNAQNTPLVSVALVVDLGGRHFWVDCEDPNYVSSTYSVPRCGSAQCLLAQARRCSNDSCWGGVDNSVTGTSTYGDLRADVVSLPSTDGSNPSRTVTVPQMLFFCGKTFLVDGLARGTKGMAGLGRSKVAMPSQFSTAFSFPRKFAICLSASNTSAGLIFFGDGPYNFLPGVDASKSLTYTPLLNNPVSTAPSHFVGEPSYEYFIGVKSIVVGNRPVRLNSKLLTIDRRGYGGTKLSTVNPYTVLQTSIFKALTSAFISEAAASWNMVRAKPVQPFEVCFSSKNVSSTRVGPAVPYIHLRLQNKNTVWTVTGSNSMVPVNGDVMCLGFVDGGLDPRTSIVIGGYQLEDNLLQFDLARSRVGFSSTLLSRQTTCGSFNFTVVS